MTATFFSLPTEVRREIYDYVFADSHSLLDFKDNTYKKPVPASEARRRLSTFSSDGNLGFLRASKQCYTDSIDSYHQARVVRIRNLGREALEEFNSLSHVYSTARTVELEGFQVNDLTSFPSFPRLQRLVLNGVKMWGGNMVVERGQTALEAFNESNVLRCLFGNIRYSSLSIEKSVSKYFPDAHIVINFYIGNQVMDKNLVRVGIQDWAWACSYDVKTERLDRRLAHRLVLW